MMGAVATESRDSTAVGRSEPHARRVVEARVAGAGVAGCLPPETPEAGVVLLHRVTAVEAPTRENDSIEGEGEGCRAAVG